MLRYVDPADVRAVFTAPADVVRALDAVSLREYLGDGNFVGMYQLPD